MKENYKKELESYFRYLGEDASSIFDDLIPIDEARLLQEFMDVVEDNRFEVDEESEDIHMVIKGKVPNDLRVKLTQLLIFFWLDRSMEDAVKDLIDLA